MSRQILSHVYLALILGSPCDPSIVYKNFESWLHVGDSVQVESFTPTLHKLLSGANLDTNAIKISELVEAK